MKCKYCNHESQMFFCPNCGKVIEYPNFIKGDIKRERQISEFVLDMVTDANQKRIEVSPDAKRQLTGKDPDAGKDRGQEEKGRQRMRWLDGITDSTNMSLSNSGRR